ncbi:beta-lactamase family protein [Chitinophagaceae bacterium LB-8]|uniref:Beta-lactamase family protein n=1 Tax=Paraflavisolibacter caeni TaxID=2982496 RepID=A0A9X2XVP5_9BACT|nr:serine hydrolase [Paraflavisolibacter caeni]MCU7549466.1 beta-lactamase family protein [Paraflavisolibacter caeni]
MKKFVFTLGVFAVVSSIGCRQESFTQPTKQCNGMVAVNSLHPMKDSLQAIISRYIARGLPGVQVAVKNGNGWYLTSGGYARTESKDTMQPCRVSWIFSITKTYTASLVMKLKEKGKINLDASIKTYLPEAISSDITGSDKITVRNLLNHASGLVDFAELPEFLTWQFSDPLNQPTMQQIIAMLKGKELLSEPGVDYKYSNTNYLLLTLILQQVSGNSYEQLLKTEITQPLRLQQTFFHLSEKQINNLDFPDYYFDRDASEQLENITPWNNALGNACEGWGGIAAAPSDVITFYEALMNGKVVNNASLQEMKTWFRGRSSEGPEYGFGLEYYQYADGGLPQMGHEGDGIGNSTIALYVPGNNTYVYINVTAGRKIFGPYLFKITDFKNEICRYVAKWK